MLKAVPLHPHLVPPLVGAVDEDGVDRVVGHRRGRLPEDLESLLHLRLVSPGTRLLGLSLLDGF